MMNLFTATLESTQESPLLSLATIGAKYTDGVSLIFPGQTEATAKHYRCNPDVTFAAGKSARPWSGASCWADRTASCGRRSP